MKRLSDLEMMDYLDGTLSPERVSAVEAHLASHAEDAELLADLKMARATLHELEASEPVRASDDFWLKVREQLPAERKSSKSILAQLGSWLWPSNSPMGMSLRVAVMAALLAMFATWFGPGQTQQPIVAGPVAVKRLSPEQKADIASRAPSKRDTKPVAGAADSSDGVDDN